MHTLIGQQHQQNSSSSPFDFKVNLIHRPASRPTYLGFWVSLTPWGREASVFRGAKPGSRAGSDPVLRVAIYAFTPKLNFSVEADHFVQIFSSKEIRFDNLVLMESQSERTIDHQFYSFNSIDHQFYSILFIGHAYIIKRSIVPPSRVISVCTYLPFITLF